MDWLIGWRTSNARNVYSFLKLALPVLVFTSVAPAQSLHPSNVHDCQPCRFSPGKQVPELAFTFELQIKAGERTIKNITIVNPQSGAVQHLPVQDVEPLAASEDFFFGQEDINFDGYADLTLLTRQGVANGYALYWLFDPKTSRYISLGEYPIFQVNNDTKHLTTYERGGAAGLIHEAKEFAFLDGKLTLTKDEKQSATSNPSVFRKTIREKFGSTLKITKTELVNAPKPQN